MKYCYLLLLLLMIQRGICSESKPKFYKRLLYPEVIKRLQAAAANYPETVRSFDAMKKYKDFLLPNTCQDDELCRHYVLKITNWKSSEEVINKRPHMLLIGSMHGNEIIGTNMLTYLAEILGKNRNREDVWDVLNSLMIIMIPMANPQGFHRVVRVRIYLKNKKKILKFFFIF